MKNITFFRLHSQPYLYEIRCNECHETIIPKDSIGDTKTIFHECLGMTEEEIIDTFLCSIFGENIEISPISF